ncbi:AzlD domain-containing protein [Leptolyngbya sp. FACHB-1515]
MNIWWIIALSGIGTYLMRSAGVWVNPKLVQGRWLEELPFAVILVITVSSLGGFTTNSASLVAAIAASLAVILTSWRKLPLIVCIAIGCVVYGLLA